MYKIPYEKESEYLEFIFTLNLFLDSYDLLIWSVEINSKNNFESYLHIETNKVDKLRAVAIEYNVEEIHCEECLTEYIRERRSKESNFFAMTISAFASIEELKVIEKKLFN